MERSVIAVIPARGGSKSIPQKNIRRFCGRPLITWSIIAALESKEVGRVLVTTDSVAIANVARNWGAEILMRPKALAGDRAPIEPVVRHAVEELMDKGARPDAVVLLMPPTPSRTPQHIDRAVRLLFEKKADSVVTVNETPANHSPYWTLVRSPRGKVTLFDGTSIKHMLPQRQAFPRQCYGRNDLVYALKPENLWQSPPNLYGNKVELLETEPEYQMDINTLDEWYDAEVKMRRMGRLKFHP